MKIQESLVALGFYSGKIDGDLNSYETRAAFKKLNTSYGIASDSSISQSVKDQLDYLYNLFELNKYLNAEGTSKRIKGKRLQSALKVYGAYHSKIDGIIGNGTRKAIAVYRMDQGMVPGTSLSADEKYELISSAIERNNNDIKEAVASLRGERGQKVQLNTDSYKKQPKEEKKRDLQLEEGSGARGFATKNSIAPKESQPLPIQENTLGSTPSHNISSQAGQALDGDFLQPSMIGAKERAD